MTTEQDKLQNMEIEKLKTEVSEIKLVTHGSEILQWGGIIPEHKKLETTVNCIKTNSDYVAKFAKTIMNIIKVVSIIATFIGIVIGIFKMI